MEVKIKFQCFCIHSKTFAFAQKTFRSQKFSDFAGKCKTGDEIEKKNCILMLLWENAKFIGRNQYFCVSPKKHFASYSALYKAVYK